MGLFDLADVGLCQWWISGGACGFMPVMDVGLCRWWVCLIWWMSGVGCGFVPVMDVGLCRFGLSGCVFFFFEVALVAVGIVAGGGRW